jgi:hypothetical protein
VRAETERGLVEQEQPGPGREGRASSTRSAARRREPRGRPAHARVSRALLDAKLIGDRIFLFVLLADREGERAIKVLLEERLASGYPR